MKQTQKGFTLLELITAISLIAIGTAIALPSLLAAGESSGIKSDARDLKNTFALCRMEAIKRNCSVTLLFNKNGYDYMGFIDTDNSCEFDPAKEVILRQNSFSHAVFDVNKSDGDGLTFIENDNGHPCLRWDSRGLPHRNGTGFGAGTAYLQNTTNRYCVIVSKTGVIRISLY